jgi:hypothetical protein
MIRIQLTAWLKAVGLIMTTLSLVVSASASDAVAANASVNGAADKSSGKEASVPESLFVLPTTPQEGRDPFFPRSTRLYRTAAVARTNQIAAALPPTVDVQLKGISGPPNHRLAILNNSTFGTGEEGEISTGAGRVRIRCLEIQADSVTIQVGSERRVIRMRSGV